MPHEVFIFLFFFSAAQKAHQTSHFGSAHGTDRQFTFLSIQIAGADENPGIFFIWPYPSASQSDGRNLSNNAVEKEYFVEKF